MGCRQNKNAGIQTTFITDDPTSVAVNASPQLSNRQGNSLANNGKIFIWSLKDDLHAYKIS